MSDKNMIAILQDPELFADFSLFAFSANGTMVEDFMELVNLQTDPNIVMLLERFDIEHLQAPATPAISGAWLTTSVIDKLSVGELKAIRVSLENSMANKRRVYTDTCASSVIYTQDYCKNLLLDLEAYSHTTGDWSVAISNPLLGILGYPKLLPDQEWTSILTQPGRKSHRYVPWQFTRDLADYQIDINAYHPLIWALLADKKHAYLNKFVRNFRAHESFLRFCETWLLKKQQYRSQYNIKS